MWERLYTELGAAVCGRGSTLARGCCMWERLYTELGAAVCGRETINIVSCQDNTMKLRWIHHS